MFQPVTISKAATAEVKDILERKKIPENYGLRVGVKGVGCGVGFNLGFDHKRDGDIAYFWNGIQVFIQKKEIMFLVGKRIDFYDEADGRGFTFVDEMPERS